MGTGNVKSEDLVILCEQGVEQVKARQFQREGAGGDDAELDARAGSFGSIDATYWATLCLVGARQIGLPVSRITLEELSAFWLRGFQPQSTSVARPMIALGLLGHGTQKEVRRAAEAHDVAAILRAARKGSRRYPGFLWEWYLAGKLAGATHRQEQAFKAELIHTVLAGQTEHGAFRGYDSSEDETKITAWAVFTLGIPKNYLPIVSPLPERVAER
jgi:hypothetical protein